ncbi:hypothetical protein CR194_12485 [Salipaludibacillus keqinensis]|uniref:N-acetyltransferase domain-containing protein n=1 Tax=Salipaludibacillus keqinensis TaxID=2045207 RepID=A0A323TEE4_9BACI|nr:hypothetical protein [Salipaludibacillus keqinensis]PYZ92484.1 hypothetical protein CR194_12485 [Salipaludibacillus keqinensis]
MSVVIREAVEEDVLAIQHFISRAGIPLDSVPLDRQKFLVAENEEKEFVATAAVQQVTDEETLLRSFIVDGGKVNGSFVLKMLETCLQYAWQKGATTVYVMVNQAGDMLEKLGFQPVSPDERSVALMKLPEVVSHLEEGRVLYKQTNSVDN